MIKSTLFYSLILISLLSNISDCKSDISHIIRVGASTIVATGLVYIPMCGFYVLKGSEKAWLNAFKPAIYGGSGLGTIFIVWANNGNYKSDKLLAVRILSTIGITTCGLLGINKLLEKKYGQEND